MTHGFLATNNSGQVLISSETRNLHFIGKATLDRTIRAFDGYGGLRHFAFRIPCGVAPVPFFTAPTADYYGVAAVREVSSGTWEIEIIRSGIGASIPEVYIFADPRSIAARDSDYGLLVYRDDGTPAFDSRLSPLAITGGTNVVPPSNPLTATVSGLSGKYCTSDPGGSMGPNNFNTTDFSPLGDKPIYFYSSVAQAEREFGFSESEEECDGVDDGYGGCIGAQRNYSWTSVYWAFYRGGIQQAGNQLKVGWITTAFGCKWSESMDGSFIGIGTGGDSGDGGSWPYSNETLNLASTAVITANGARYD
jgi:hypothetical protein